ncbi:MAG TPA: AMP-binding protein [Candidatus Binatia bacterium]|nr:AMP-binding protein [Candidatus Binatia bacterium]
MTESIAAFVLEHFRAHADDCAYAQRRGYRTEKFTYRQVLELAFTFTRELERRAIGKGDRVMLWGENSAEWVAAFFGCTLRGVVVVPMDDGASADFARRVCSQVGAKLVVASHRHCESICDLGGVVSNLEDVSEASCTGQEFIDAVLPGRNDILEIVFTSGTTADPKGVVITHGNVLANIAPLEEEIRAYLKYERLVHPVRFLNLLPLSHVFGQFLSLFLPPLMGGTVIFQSELKPSEVMNTICRERVSVLVSVPRVLQSLKHKVERDIDDRGDTTEFRKRFVTAKGKHFLRRWWMFRTIRRQFSWKFWAFISGGAALDADTEEFWERLGYAVIQGYGLTETTSLISVNHPFRIGKGSIGKILPGREVKLADDGEILVKGGGVAPGYWDSSGTRTVSDEQGWYRTGDIGALDDAGHLYFRGRKKEVIITPSGMNVYPGDLEAALLGQPEVKDCVVVGIERDGNAEPCAVVIMRDRSDLRNVVRRANESLAEYQRMQVWMEWPEEDFPRTNTLKPKRQAISDFVRARMEGSGSTAAQARNGPLSEMISRVAGRTVSALRPDATLDSDIGLSSLDRVELLSALEDRYQVDLSEARFSSVRTVGDLEQMMRGGTTPVEGYHYPCWVLRWPVTWIRLLAHYLLMRPAIMLLGWPRILGREHLREVKGPLLVISNHLGHVDPGFILTALPARFRHRLAIATGGEALEALRSAGLDRNWFLRAYDRMKWILGVSLLNLFPLPREAGFRRSFAYAGEAVDRGYSILVFPEGRHTTDGKLLPFRSGIGLLAQNLAIPVLPMRIDGLFELKQVGKKFALPWKVSVRIGTPVTFSPYTDAAAVALELRERIANL